MINKKRTCELTDLQIKKIIKLKNSYWNYSLKSQSNWFKKNIGENDIHFFETKNKQIVKYLVFREITIYTSGNKKNGYLRDTLIARKKK